MSQMDFSDTYSPSRADSSTSSLGLMPFGFPAKTNYDANESLIQIRSENFEKKVVEKEEDIWKRPPPDFRRQCYAPKPPRRNAVESMRPWLYGTIPGQREIIKRPRRKVIPHLLQPQREEEKKFETYYHIDRPFTAKKKSVIEGMYEAGEYENPKPHDFRGYPPLKTLGLPEFIQSEDKDPFNIKFHTDRLNIIHGSRVDKATDRDIKGRQMAPPKTPEPSWDVKYILDKPPWPIKNEAYTRHRLKHRPAASAFMERVTHELNHRWAREQYEKRLALVSAASR